jgi:hypothetical protein
MKSEVNEVNVWITMHKDEREREHFQCDKMIRAFQQHYIYEGIKTINNVRKGFKLEIVRTICGHEVVSEELNIKKFDL